MFIVIIISSTVNNT